MAYSEDIGPKIKIVRSKSDVPITEELGDETASFLPIHSAEESLAASLVEDCSTSAEEARLDEMVDVEEPYAVKELGVSVKEVFLLI